MILDCKCSFLFEFRIGLLNQSSRLIELCEAIILPEIELDDEINKKGRNIDLLCIGKYEDLNKMSSVLSFHWNFQSF